MPRLLLFPVHYTSLRWRPSISTQKAPSVGFHLFTNIFHILTSHPASPPVSLPSHQVISSLRYCYSILTNPHRTKPLSVHTVTSIHNTRGSVVAPFRFLFNRHLLLNGAVARSTTWYHPVASYPQLKVQTNPQPPTTNPIQNTNHKSPTAHYPPNPLNIASLLNISTILSCFLSPMSQTPQAPPAEVMSGHRRGPWSNSEDEYLMALVRTHGPLNWVRIASTLGSRTPKQCRERYHQNLKPTLNHQPITPEEGLQIELLVQQLGKRWAEIARRLHGRSDNAVKNWWNGSQNRRRRMDRRRATQSHEASYNRSALSISTPALPLPRTQASPRVSYAYQQPLGWMDAPLPSPCTSESAESEYGSNYTTSPGRHSLPLHAPVELPPLRSSSMHFQNHSQLPGFNSVARPGYGDVPECQPRLPGLSPQGQLPTAPSSPIQQQQQEHQQQQFYQPYQAPMHQRPGSCADKDSRMNLSTLLG